MTNLRANFAVVLVAGLVATSCLAQPADVTKTNPLKVYMHYMPWFETPATLGGSSWGYHWRFNNRNPNIARRDRKAPDRLALLPAHRPLCFAR